MGNDLTPDLVQRALNGKIEARRQLVEELIPVIQYKVGLWILDSVPGREPRKKMEDLVEEVFQKLFEGDSKLLRRWDEKRGPLEDCVDHIVTEMASQWCCIYA